MALATKQRDAAHGRVYAEWLSLPAWRDMGAAPRALLIELLTKYRPTEPNFVELSDRKAASILGCSRPTAAKAVAKLVECGWLEVERHGGMKGRFSKRSSGYSLTMQPLFPGDAPTRAFMKWRPVRPHGQRSGQ
jgi:hypothetical protein